MNTAVHFSSQTDLWATPQDFFDGLNAEFSFETDVCANEENAKCPTWYGLEQNGLAQEWVGMCWMNPPYGRAIKHWVRKAYESSLTGATVVCLLPSRTDTAWWHDYCMKGEIRFIRGRLKFGGQKNSAPFPSAVIIFRGAGEVKYIIPVVYTALTTNGLFWQRIIQLRTKNGEYQGKLLNTGRWTEITELREG